VWRVVVADATASADAPDMGSHVGARASARAAGPLA